MTDDPYSLLVIFQAMAATGVGLHPVEQIVNVQWGELAVLFGPTDKDAPPRSTIPA